LFKIVNFFIFENSKGNTIIWIIKFFFGNKFHYLQRFNAQNLMQIDNVSKVIINTQNFGVDCFCYFFFSNVHHSFSKLKWILILMIKRDRKLEIGKIHFYNTLEHFWFKFVFGLENHEC